MINYLYILDRNLLFTKAIAMTNSIQGTENPDILLGTFGNDEIMSLGGNDTIIGTAGSDILDGGDGIDTVDFSSFTKKITLFPQGVFSNGSQQNGQLVSIEKIVAPVGFNNEINASSARGGVSLDVDLSKNSLIVNDVPGIGTQTFTVKNFVEVKGTVQSDILIGNEANNKLVGKGGNDFLVGSGGNDTLRGDSGNDTLTGTDSVFRGAGEKDILSGNGFGTNTYILGDEEGSFYQAQSNRDLAVIRDFNFGELIQLGANETYNIENNNAGFNVFLTTDSQKDLIARVRFDIAVSESVSFAPQALSINSLEADLSKALEGEFTIASGEIVSDIFIGA